MTNPYHVPVLVDEVLHYLQAERAGIYVDGTLGGGGHAESIFNASSRDTQVIGFDVDDEALMFARRRLNKFEGRLITVQDNLARMKHQLQCLNLYQVDGIVFDLGVSSHQIDTGERGFSFQQKGRLDMRMSREQALDASTIINSYDADLLADVFKKYGEERNSRRIAKRIVAQREQKAFETTYDLSEAVKSVVGAREVQKTLARIFQAIRIEVNDELNQLRAGLRGAIDSLTVGGRIVVISYHSLEDRIVKRCFAEESSSRTRVGTKLLPDIPRQPRLAVLTKKPIVPGNEEIRNNPRARSAKLRAAEKITA